MGKKRMGKKRRGGLGVSFTGLEWWNELDWNSGMEE